METITAESIWGTLVFKYENFKFSVSGPEIAVKDWKRIKREGIFNAWGFSVDSNNCLISDLANALIDKYGRDSLKWNNTVEEQIKLELKREIPTGAIP